MKTIILAAAVLFCLPLSLFPQADPIIIPGESDGNGEMLVTVCYLVLVEPGAIHCVCEKVPVEVEELEDGVFVFRSPRIQPKPEPTRPIRERVRTIRVPR